MSNCGRKQEPSTSRSRDERLVGPLHMSGVSSRTPSASGLGLGDGPMVCHYKLVRADGPDDLVFQSVKDGNILKRYIAPAALTLGLKVNWRSLRTSCATWMVRAGPDPKSVQGQMRHSRISTTMDIYAQFVPEGQKQAQRQLRAYVERSVPAVPIVFQ